MEFQPLINSIIALVGVLGGWVLNNISNSIRTLQEQDIHLAEKVQDIEVLVAGAYVKRDEMQEMTKAIFKKLDRIEGKLDLKADK